MLIAQITDLHIKRPGRLAYGKVDTAPMLQKALAHLGSLDIRPDVVIATGDLVDGGKPEEYDHLGRLLAELGRPVYLMPGNHDDRRALFDTLPQDYWRQEADFLHYVIDDHPVRIVALDSLKPGTDGGQMCESRLAWLDARLAEDARPTVVALHHPPFPTGIVWMDEIGLENAAAMAAIVARHPHVERVIAGHMHRSIQTRFGGTIASTAPSTAHQVVLDLSPAGYPGFTFEPPGFDLHLYRPGFGLISHTVQVGPVETHPFDMPEGYTVGGTVIA